VNKTENRWKRTKYAYV